MVLSINEISYLSQSCPIGVVCFWSWTCCSNYCYCL